MRERVFHLLCCNRLVSMWDVAGSQRHYVMKLNVRLAFILYAYKSLVCRQTFCVYAYKIFLHQEYSNLFCTKIYCSGDQSTKIYSMAFYLSAYQGKFSTKCIPNCQTQHLFKVIKLVVNIFILLSHSRN